jgi:co-chaperonin GroES (HSP10)
MRSFYFCMLSSNFFIIMTIQLSPGDGVRFRDFAGSDIKIEGVEYRVIRAYDILANWRE